jgi:2',5'-phosphodiesterase
MKYRLPLILQKLQEEMDRSPSSSGGAGLDKIMADAALSKEDNKQQQSTSSSPPPPPTIFALQEICYSFTSELHAFFAQRGYQFVTGLYGKKFNGYMGVGIAYPTEHFETVKVDICRLSDERIDGWPREEEIIDEDAAKKGGPGFIQQFSKIINQFIRNRVIKQLGFNQQQQQQQQREPIDPWEMSENRFNVLVSVALRHRHKGASSSSSTSDGTFLISNYHMPCAFYAPPVMNIHSEMVTRRVQTLAANVYESLYDDKKEEGEKDINTIPYILAGDFNIMPDSPHYKLLTTGSLDKSDPTYPPAKFGVEWTIEAEAMDSAYAEIGEEPEFTNYAHIQDQENPFIGTLDYIFLSRKSKTTRIIDEKVAGEWWKVNGVTKLPSVAESGGPFPNAVEPSDHLLISADLELVSKK